MKQALICCAIAFVITAAIGPSVIRYLRKMKFGQKILEIGPKWHMNKQNIPTMGGFMFIIGIALAVILGGLITGTLSVHALAILGLSAAYGAVGLVDDYAKIKKKENAGLTPRQKLVLQILVAAVFILVLFLESDGLPSLMIPFTGISIDLPWPVYIIFAAFVIVGTVNSVNLTDGVDGLSASLAVVTIGTYLIAYHEELADYSTAGVVFMGALLAYLWSNAKPSTLLMGDAGSRAMGFFIAILSLKCGHPFAFLLAAIVFIVDGSLGILKISLKRFLHISILKNTRTPLHDHVRKNKGWSDEQVVARWLILQCVASALLLLVVNG